MLGENIRRLRKQKGLTQEELAIRFNVVRQTVSKWEKNLSVPDAEMLGRIAEELESSVRELLCMEIPDGEEMGELAEQLARINEQLAVRNHRSKRIWTGVLAVVAVFMLGSIMLALLGARNYSTTKDSFSEAISMSDENPVYSEEEVKAAINVVTKNFKRTFKGCKLISISYDEEYSRIQSESFREQYDVDDIIVLRSDFTTDARGGDGSLNPNSTYTDWNWILIRTNKGKWILKDWGYA